MNTPRRTLFAALATALIPAACVLAQNPTPSQPAQPTQPRRTVTVPGATPQLTAAPTPVSSGNAATSAPAPENAPPPLAPLPVQGNLAPMAPADAPVINGDNLPGLAPPPVAGGDIFNDVERRAIDARRARDLSEDVDPNTPRAYTNTDNLPLSTLLLVLARQARIPYIAPQFKEDKLTTFYSPTPILPADAFKFVAEHNGYTVTQDGGGIFTLKPTSTSYRLATYVMHNIQPPFAMQDLAQGLGFTIAKPAGNIQTYPAPSGSGSAGGGSSSGLVGGGGNDSDEQVQPRYTAGLPMDTPVSQRKDATETALIYVDRANHAIVIYDTETHQALARQIINRIDRGEPQVRLETQVVQVSRTNDSNVGFDWTQSLGTGLTFNFTPGTSSAGINNFFFYPQAGVFSYPNIQTTLHALETHGLVRTINHTFITMKQGVPTPISDTTEESVVLQSGYTGSTTVNTGGTGGGTSSGGGLSSTSQIEKYHYGVTFDALVWLKANNKVDINLNPQVSAKIGETQTSEGPIPIISRQKTTQDIDVPSGKTFCFAGTIRTTNGRTDTDVPLLARTPILGPLFFRNRVKTDEIATLVYFVTPTIIWPSDSPDLRMLPDDAQYVSEFNRDRPDFVPGRAQHSTYYDNKDYGNVPVGRAVPRTKVVPSTSTH